MEQYIRMSSQENTSSRFKRQLFPKTRQFLQVLLGCIGYFSEIQAYYAGSLAKL